MFKRYALDAILRRLILIGLLIGGLQVRLLPRCRLLVRLVFAALRVDALWAHEQALDWLSSHDVGVDDLIHVIERDSPVPDGFGIDDQVGAVLALVEASGLVGANSSF